MRKTVVVTGGARGLGLCITERLLSNDYNVVAIARTESSGIQDLACDSLIFKSYEFTDLKGIHTLSKELHALALTHFSGPIFGLINNAAVGLDGVLGTMHETDINTVLTVNVQAPILLTKYVSREMMLNNIAGRIVNVGSIIASTGYAGLSVYAASKAAIEGFTRSLARELGKLGITVNVVAPGFMATEMTATLGQDDLEKIKRRSALGELATIESVANAVSYLLSEEASLVTGTVLTVDGGSTA